MFNLGPDNEPEVLSIPGEVIAARLREYIDQGKVAMRSYQAAADSGIKGAPWGEYIETVRRELAGLEVISEHVSVGPHRMSISGFKRIWSHTNPWRMADEITRDIGKQQAMQGQIGALGGARDILKASA